MLKILVPGPIFSLKILVPRTIILSPFEIGLGDTYCKVVLVCACVMSEGLYGLDI